MWRSRRPPQAASKKILPPAKPTRRFEARRDIDSVAENVAVLDNDVAEVDADAEPDAPLVADHRLTLDHPALHFGGATDRIDHAWKFREEPVAGVLDNAAVVLLDLRLDQLTEMRLEALMCPVLVGPHKAARGLDETALSGL